MEIAQEVIENAIRWALNNQHRTDYRFKCLAFVEDAYEQGNQIEMFGGSTAKESAEMYGVNNTEPPPKGAFVFYSAVGPIDGITKDWGHVGLCLGKHDVIHTWDVIRVDPYSVLPSLPNAPGWGPLTYLGWTPPEIFLQGCHTQDDMRKDGR